MAYDLENPPSSTKDEWTVTRWLQKITEFIRTFYVIANVSANYTITDRVFYIRVNATGGAVTITLPTASASLGRRVLIKKIDSSGNAVTVSRAGSDTIEGSNTVSLAAQWNKSYLMAGAVLSWEKIV